VDETFRKPGLHGQLQSHRLDSYEEHSGIMGQINWLSLRLYCLSCKKKGPGKPGPPLVDVSVRSHRGDRQRSADGQIGRDRAEGFASAILDHIVASP
jgi:hypothetical protein